MRESEVEKQFVAAVKAAGGQALKFTSQTIVCMVARFMSTSTSINAEKPRSAASQQYPGGRHRKKHRLMICRPTSGRL